MTTKQQLQTKITELEAELQSFKQQLNNYKEVTIETATIGDVLEDGCIVVHKTDNMALLAAPSSTEVRCVWSKEFSEVFDALKTQGFNPSQWFIPTREQMVLTFKNCKQHFHSLYYWTSTELSSTIACFVNYENVNVVCANKLYLGTVRAFRIVNF